MPDVILFVVLSFAALFSRPGVQPLAAFPSCGQHEADSHSQLPTYSTVSPICDPSSRPKPALWNFPTGLTAVMVVRNALDLLPTLVHTLRAMVDEIRIVDQSSDDGTWEWLAQQTDISAVRDRNWGWCERSFPLLYRGVRTEWSFYIDADELPSKQLVSDAKRVVADERINDCLFVMRRNMHEGMHATSERKIRFCRTGYHTSPLGLGTQRTPLCPKLVRMLDSTSYYVAHRKHRRQM